MRTHVAACLPNTLGLAARPQAIFIVSPALSDILSSGFGSRITCLTGTRHFDFRESGRAKTRGGFPRYCQRNLAIADRSIVQRRAIADDSAHQDDLRGRTVPLGDSLADL